MYEYSLPQWLLIFYIYCFCGWIFESIVVSVGQKRLADLFCRAGGCDCI